VRPLVMALAAGMMPAVAAADPPGDAVRLTASMPERPIGPGDEHVIDLTVSIDEGWTLAGGNPKPLLQLDVPAGVTLSGRVVEGDRALAGNGFVEEPWERLIDVGRSTVGFTIGDTAPGDAAISLNVLLYVRPADAEGPAAFVRRRVDLPLEPEATATASEPAIRSNWGRNGTLHVGERAVGFELPRADGTIVDFEVPADRAPAAGGEGDDRERDRPAVTIVTTYRAHW